MWQRWLPSAQLIRGHGGGTEEYLSAMRAKGATAQECLPLVCRVEQVEEEQARRILAASPSWSDVFGPG